MNTPTMTQVHGSTTPVAAPWAWQLSSRQARRLAPAPVLRWLAVQQGRVWLTRSQQQLQPGEDVWLGAGQQLPLPPGSEWVAEGWPEARVLVLQAPQQS